MAEEASVPDWRRFTFAVGAEQVFNDPFVSQTGARAAFRFAPSPWVELEVAAGTFISLGVGGCGDPDWSALTCQMLEVSDVSPDIAKMGAWGRLAVGVVPFRIGEGRWRSAAGAFVGVEALATNDDLVALQAVGEPAALATENQVHPVTVWGVFGEAGGRHMALRLRFEVRRYVETVNSTILESKMPMTLGAEVAWEF